MNRREYFHHVDHRKKQQNSKLTLWITFFITLIFTIVDFVGGVLSNSLALLSDSFHMLSDVIALSLSMVAIYFATKKPTSRFTFGYLRLEILAAFLNGLALMIISLWILYEAVKRMIYQQPIESGVMVIIATIGLFVNIVLTIVLVRSLKQEDNINVQSALWHFMGDLLNSIGVIVAVVLIHFGLETVGLQGEGFTVHVDSGETIVKGQSLMTVDLDYIKTHAKSDITPIIVTNSGEHEIKTTHDGTVDIGEVLIKL